MTERTIEVRGEITEKDYLHLQWLRMKPRRRYRIIWYVILFLAVLSSVPLFVAAAVSPEPNTVLCALFVPTVVALFPWCMRQGWRRTYRGQPGLRGTHRCTYSESGCEWESPHASGRASWDVFVKWRESSQMFLLYQADNLMSLIPKRWFQCDTDAVDAFRELLQQQDLECIE